MDYYHYVHDSLIGWLRPYLSLLIWSSLDGCAHTLDLDYSVLCFGWLRPYHIYIMYLRYQLYFSTQVFWRRGFSWTCSRKAFHPSLSRASYFRGHLLHNNLSPSLPFPVPHNGGPILWPVNIVMPSKHHQCIPLSMSFICPKDISLQKSWKTSLFALARADSSILVPMGKILQRGRANWRSVPEQYSR